MSNLLHSNNYTYVQKHTIESRPRAGTDGPLMTTQLGHRKVREAGTPSPTPKKKLHTSRPNSPPTNVYANQGRERALTEVIEVHEDESMETSPEDRAPVTAPHLSFFDARMSMEHTQHLETRLLEGSVQHVAAISYEGSASYVMGTAPITRQPIPEHAVYFPSHGAGPTSTAGTGPTLSSPLARPQPSPRLQSSTSSMSEVSNAPLRPRNIAPVNLATMGLVQTYTNLTKNFKKMLRKTQQAKKNNYYNVSIGEVLNNKYEVLSVLGKGSFGQVVKAKLTGHSEEDREALVAIKIIRKSTPFLNQGRQEIRILKLLQDVDSSNNFLVNMKEEFMYEGHLCIVFELLSSSLLELVGWTNSDEVQGLSLRMVHKFSHQLVCALATLRTLQVIHCDLKPENIALLHPNRAHIKVLDFGSACQPWENQVNHFPYIQSRFYRAPEILLGTPYSFPIDMWSLGCVLVELYTARPLFPGRDSIEQLYKIMEVLGPPPNNMLEQAVYLKKYFVKKGNELFLKEDYPFKARNLRELVFFKNHLEEPKHLENFLDLVTRMLVYDPNARISPAEALTHPFILYGPGIKQPTNPFNK